MLIARFHGHLGLNMRLQLLFLTSALCVSCTPSAEQAPSDEQAGVERGGVQGGDAQGGAEPYTGGMGDRLELGVAGEARSEDAEPPMDQALVDAGPPTPPAPYEVVVLDQAPIYSYGEENFQNALGALDFGEGPFASVVMEVTLHTTCFPFESWSDDPPPDGQRWPPSCDAFDRNFELHLRPNSGPLDPTSQTPAEFEVMRAITPFGGPSRYELDLTDYANVYPHESEARVHITTWSDASGQVSGSQGMWRVSLKARVTPGPAPREVVALVPIFNRNLRLADGPLEVPFTVPEGVREARLEYRATGHGGGDDPSPRCIGPAEEFCERTHILGADGFDLETFTPWREGCEAGCTLTQYEDPQNSFEYCAENPTGLPQSVRASRANWCPGALTPAYELSVPRFTQAGEHSLYLEVQGLHPDGVWRVSAHLYLYR